MNEIRLETTAGPLEVWLGKGGEVRVFALDESDRAVRMLGRVVGEESELASLLEEFELVEREAAFYAHEIWIRVSPTPEPGLKLRRLVWGHEVAPESIWYGGPTG